MLVALVYVAVFCIMFSVAYYAVTRVLPEPMRPAGLVVLYIVAAILVCIFLLNLVGAGGLSVGNWPRLR